MDAVRRHPSLLKMTPRLDLFLPSQSALPPFAAVPLRCSAPRPTTAPHMLVFTFTV